MKYQISDLIKKNPRAVKAFVNEHKLRVYRTCLGYVQNESDANDLTQEVLVKALQSLEGFKAKASLKTWVTRIAINYSLNFIRDNKKYRNNTQIDKVGYMLSDESIESDYLMNKNEIQQRLSTAINSLPERQKKVFVLFHYNDQSYAQISEVTGDSVSAVESLLQRARKNLQLKLASYYEENFK